MEGPASGTTIAMLRLLAFLFSVLASVIAAQLYLLARSGTPLFVSAAYHAACTGPAN